MRAHSDKGGLVQHQLSPPKSAHEFNPCVYNEGIYVWVLKQVGVINSMFEGKISVFLDLSILLISCNLFR